MVHLLFVQLIRTEEEEDLNKLSNQLPAIFDSDEQNKKNHENEK